MWEHKEKVLRKQHILYALRLGVATVMKGINLEGVPPVVRSLKLSVLGMLFCRAEKKWTHFSKMISFIDRHAETLRSHLFSSVSNYQASALNPRLCFHGRGIGLSTF